MNNFLNQLKPIGRCAAANMAKFPVPLEYQPNISDILTLNGLHTSAMCRSSEIETNVSYKDAIILVTALIIVITTVVIVYKFNTEEKKEST